MIGKMASFSRTELKFVTNESQSLQMESFREIAASLEEWGVEDT